jgi:G3E family GTPase
MRCLVYTSKVLVNEFGNLGIDGALLEGMRHQTAAAW